MSLLNEVYLKPGTPYMLRNDGKLFGTDGYIHPYIWYDVKRPAKEELEQLIDLNTPFLQFFFENTQHVKLKRDIANLISSVLQSRDFNISGAVRDDPIVQRICNFADTCYTDLDEIIDLFKLVNINTNQEFLRIRMSDMRLGGSSGELYCRLSSVDFNWYLLLFNLVSENRLGIESITIGYDACVSDDGFRLVRYRGITFDHLPTYEFLYLKGNPVVESLENGATENLFSNIVEYDELRERDLNKFCYGEF